MVYVFKRHKQTGRKTIIRENETIDTAREICQKENKHNSLYWFEFSVDYEQTRNSNKKVYVEVGD